MIEAENYGKITENSRNLQENSLKNPKILAMGGGGGGAAFAAGTGFSNFYF